MGDVGCGTGAGSKYLRPPSSVTVLRVVGAPSGVEAPAGAGFLGAAPRSSAVHVRRANEQVHLDRTPLDWRADVNRREFPTLFARATPMLMRQLPTQAATFHKLPKRAQVFSCVFTFNQPSLWTMLLIAVFLRTSCVSRTHATYRHVHASPTQAHISPRAVVLSCPPQLLHPGARFRRRIR